MRADAPATRRSHHAASSTPPATHQPSMAAMTGLPSCRRVGPSGPLSSQLGQVAQVGAGAERRVVAGEHGHACRRVLVERHEGVVEAGGRLAVDGVADVALVDADDDDAVGVVGLGHVRTVPSPPMRVISGAARGRKLVAPEGPSTRPTPDRVREATFNALGSLGAVVDATVLDLFAGSGALGIEALSRGAAHVTFVDQDRAARPAVEANLTTTGLAAQATVVASPVDRFLRGRRRSAVGPGPDRSAVRPLERRVARPPRRPPGRPGRAGVRSRGRSAVRVGGAAIEALRPHARADRGSDDHV